MSEPKGKIINVPLPPVKDDESCEAWHRIDTYEVCPWCGEELPKEKPARLTGGLVLTDES